MEVSPRRATPPPASAFRDLKDRVYPLFESDTLFLECFAALLLYA